MAQATNYDAVVIGSSRGGRLLPIAFAKAGWKVALIERDHVGGTCINVGCTPTKTMVASARLASLARRGGEYGVHTGPIAVDLQAIHQRKHRHLEIRTLKGLLNSKKEPRSHRAESKPSMRGRFTVGFTKWAPYLQMSA
jgi:pyruvate/2-oxoglutarate dehydrogenase complex dihydrolipoamide dehydrogenase (E3) component